MGKPAYSIPYTGLAREAGDIKKELLAAVESVLDGGRYILGPEVAAFEREFADYCRVGFVGGPQGESCSQSREGAIKRKSNFSQITQITQIIIVLSPMKI